jgi:carbon-monoxide dehydrogenase medium subunit
MIGSTQIKNRASIGGNICNAAPSADSAPPLLCLDSKVAVTSVEGDRVIPIEEFIKGPGETSLRNNELLLRIEIPNSPSNSAGCYLRHTTREEMDIAVAGVASFLVINPQNKRIKLARIALGAVAPTPIRTRNCEDLLTNQIVTRSLINEVSEKASSEAKPISDVRGTSEYRKELVKVLTRRTLENTMERLGISI